MTNPTTPKSKNPLCPCCRSNSWVGLKGFIATGAQRYRCYHCERYFVTQHRLRGYNSELKLKVFALKAEGLNNRAISRLLGINHQTVNNWVNSPEKEGAT